MDIDKTLDIKKTIIWYSMGTTFYFFSQWILTIIVAKVAGMDTAGDYALALSSSNVVYQIALFGMRSYQISDINKRFRHKDYIFSRFITCFAAIAIGTGFCLFTTYSIIQKLCIMIYMLFRLSEAGMDVLQGIMQSSSRMDLAGKSLIVRGLVQIFLFTFVLWMTNDLLISLIFMAAFSFVWMYVYEYSQSSQFIATEPHIRKEKGHLFQQQKALLLSCVPILVSNLVYSFIVFLPRYYIERIYGTDLLGSYASIAAPALVIPMLASYIYTPLIPLFTKYDQENKIFLLKRLAIKLAMIILVIAIVLLIAAALFGEWGLIVLFGKSIKPHAYLLMPIIISVICTSYVFYLNAILVSLRRFLLLIVSSSVAVAINIAITRLCVHYSLNGASFDIIFVQLVQIVFALSGLCLYIKKRTKTNMIQE